MNKKLLRIILALLIWLPLTSMANCPEGYLRYSQVSPTSPATGGTFYGVSSVAQEYMPYEQLFLTVCFNPKAGPTECIQGAFLEETDEGITYAAYVPASPPQSDCLQYRYVIAYLSNRDNYEPFYQRLYLQDGAPEPQYCAVRLPVIIK